MLMNSQGATGWNERNGVEFNKYPPCLPFSSVLSRVQGTEANSPFERMKRSSEMGVADLGMLLLRVGCVVKALSSAWEVEKPGRGFWTRDQLSRKWWTLGLSF